MKSVLRAVIDTNVFVSALGGSSVCHEIYELFKRNKFHLVMSNALFEEIISVVSRPRFTFTDARINALDKRLRRKSKWAFPQESVSVCRDPKNNMVLECALAGHADCIVTGDKDLLSLEKFKEIALITPQQFMNPSPQ